MQILSKIIQFKRLKPGTALSKYSRSRYRQTLKMVEAQLVEANF